MTKSSVRRKFGMVGTLDSNTTFSNSVRTIEQYPEQRFHFSRSFDHDDRALNDSKDSTDICQNGGLVVDRPRAKANQSWHHRLHLILFIRKAIGIQIQEAHHEHWSGSYNSQPRAL